jgi:hypothetical protein
MTPNEVKQAFGAFFNFYGTLCRRFVRHCFALSPCARPAPRQGIGPTSAVGSWLSNRL